MMPVWWEGDVPGNLWLGTTVENQEEADRRIPHLLATPAAIRFLSCEPLLGPIDLSTAPAIGRSGWLRPLTGDHHLSPVHADHKGAKIDWIITGGESGPNARPSHPDWFRSLKSQCNASGVAFFMKQITKGGKKTPIHEWPDDLRTREFPDVAQTRNR